MEPKYSFDHSWGKFLLKKHYLMDEAAIERKWREKESWPKIRLTPIDKMGASVAYRASIKRTGFWVGIGRECSWCDGLLLKLCWISLMKEKGHNIPKKTGAGMTVEIVQGIYGVSLCQVLFPAALCIELELDGELEVFFLKVDLVPI
jgi:hypothetical protein